MSDSKPSISIVGKRARVVDADGFTIDELAGNVSTNSDRLSIAMVNAKAGTSEPWLTLHYDEWICILEGKAQFESDLPTFCASAGETIYIERGTRFRPSFPEDTKYIPVCFPAFRPDRCIREDTDDSGRKIAETLQKLHDLKEDVKNASPEAASTEANISIVGGKVRVVDAPGLTIDELAGNVATKCDRLSVALVHAKAGSSEPWLTHDYDLWMCVLDGAVRFESISQVLDVSAGQTVFIQKGTRFRPSFPEDSTYVPVCVPAFRPDRCQREDPDESGKEISEKLKQLHDNVLYHMTKKAEWEQAKKSGHAYYPKTYEQDGYITHATAVATRLIDTANHYYQDIVGEWVCLQVTRQSLRRAGITVKDEEALPVGDAAIGKEMENWICPHIMGGIPPAVVDSEYAIQREGKRFVKIIGL